MSHRVGHHYHATWARNDDLFNPWTQHTTSSHFSTVRTSSTPRHTQHHTTPPGGYFCLFYLIKGRAKSAPSVLEHIYRKKNGHTCSFLYGSDKYDPTKDPGQAVMVCRVPLGQGCLDESFKCRPAISRAPNDPVRLEKGIQGRLVTAPTRLIGVVLTYCIYV